MTRFVCGAGLAVVLALGAAGQEPDSPFDPAKLIGRWEPVMPKKDAPSVVEFAAGGKVVFTAGVGSKVERWQGTTPRRTQLENEHGHRAAQDRACRIGG